MKKGIQVLLAIIICLTVLTGCAKDTDSILSKDKLQDNVGSTEQKEDSTSEPFIIEFESVNLEGEKVTSECFANSRLTMINVWGTYCGPCLNEMPDLGEISDEYEDSEFQIIGVVCDVEADANKKSIDNVKELVAETKANYMHLLLSESLYNNLVYAAEYVPTSFFFNQKGEYLGYVQSAYPKDVWIGVIEQLLAEME